MPRKSILTKSTLNTKDSQIRKANFYFKDHSPKDIFAFISNPDLAPPELRKYLPKQSISTTKMYVDVRRSLQVKEGILDLKPRGRPLGLTEKAKIIIKLIKIFPKLKDSDLKLLLEYTYPGESFSL